jgi:hypothetical protein
LILLTGPAGRRGRFTETLATVATLRGRYPAVVVGALGTADAPATEHGVLVLTAVTGSDFARVWDGVRTW